MLLWVLRGAFVALTLGIGLYAIQIYPLGTPTSTIVLSFVGCLLAGGAVLAADLLVRHKEITTISAVYFGLLLGLLLGTILSSALEPFMQDWVIWAPRWSATLNGESVPITRRSDGYMEIAAPAGQYDLRIVYSVTKLDWFARALFVLGVIATPVLVVNAASPTVFAWIVERWGWGTGRVSLLVSCAASWLAMELMSRWYERQRAAAATGRRREAAGGRRAGGRLEACATGRMRRRRRALRRGASSRRRAPGKSRTRRRRARSCRCRAASSCRP